MAAPQESNESSARPAAPLLAAQLMSDEELDDLLENACSIGSRKRRDTLDSLGTGVRSLDYALGCALESGKLISISADTGAGGSELCRTLLVSSLFKDPHSTAAVIDTSGNFDILRLYALILSHLGQNPGALSSLHSSTATSESEPKIEDVAAIVLDRVKIMRVFDFVGVRESIGEIRDFLEGRVALTSKEGVTAKEHAVDERKLPVIKTPPKRTVVADSEDEEGEEMLFDLEPAPAPAPAPAVQEQDTVQYFEVESTERHQEQDNKGDNGSRVKFILIDNLASVINPLLKKDYIQANALASTFLTALTHLTRTHNLYTLVLNPTTTPRSLTQPQPQNQHQATPAPPSLPQRLPQTPQPPSIFASSSALPSLMNVLGRHVDVGLLVTRVPRRKMDARVFYSDVEGTNRGSTVRHGKGPEMVGVVEVMSDRWERRVGAWGTFVESETGLKDLS
ncbi:Nn.00g025860.m01.CDS01 [Neocucurbitaria sp. VM-36]